MPSTPASASWLARLLALATLILLTAHCESVLGIHDVPTPVDASTTPDGGGGDGAACVSKTCAQLGASVCGPQNDGCGNAIDCGGCAGGMACSAAGQCACVPTTCPALSAMVDAGALDSGALDSGAADSAAEGGAPDDAGDAGVHDGGPDAADAGDHDAGNADAGDGGAAEAGSDGGTPVSTIPVCGVLPDGCGGTLNCGTCSGVSQQCVNNVCQCVPTSCAAQNAACGQVPDGCGGTYDCGACTGTTPNCTNGTCTATPCTPTATCTGHCGLTADGCGHILMCADDCVAPQTCGGGGVPSVCGCTPTTCAKQGATCGTISDGCGGTVTCTGTCTAPDTCGGGTTPNVCGCTPTTCAKLDKNCGAPANGCGGTLSCGSCTSPDTCGGGGTANVCGCSTLTCSACCGTGVNGCGESCSRSTCCGTCFVAGTKISLADGTTRAIEAIKVGELVKSYDPASGRFVAATVKEVVRHDAQSSTEVIMVIDGVLHVTPNHPMHVGGRQVRADELKVGDELVVVEGGAPRGRVVSSVEREPGLVPTFDLVVDGPGNFVAEGIVVDIKPVQP